MFLFMVAFLKALSIGLSLAEQGGEVQGIPNGVEVAPHANPFMVHIRVDSLLRNGTRLSSSCAGTIIDQSWILSAAHCFKILDSHGQPMMFNQDAESVTVLAGTNNIQNYDQGYQIRNVSEIHNPLSSAVVWTNEDADKDPRSILTNDIALLRLETPLVFSESIGIIYLLRDESMIKEEGGYVAGWGMKTNKPSPPNTLQEIHYDKIYKDGEICQKDWHNTLWNRGTPNHVICTKKANGGPCLGDSGGPLYVKYNNGNLTMPVQLGVSLSSIPGERACEHDKEMTINYAWVSKNCNWIRQIIDKRHVCLDGMF